MNDTLIKDWMNFMVFSASLCGNYENWKNNPNISEIINVKTNPMCVNLKNNYPNVDDKVIQSITLGFFFNMHHVLTHSKLENENDDIPSLIDLEID